MDHTHPSPIQDLQGTVSETRLELLGWFATGKCKVDNIGGYMAPLTGTGEWAGGQLVQGGPSAHVGGLS